MRKEEDVVYRSGMLYCLTGNGYPCPPTLLYIS